MTNQHTIDRAFSRFLGHSDQIDPGCQFIYRKALREKSPDSILALVNMLTFDIYEGDRSQEHALRERLRLRLLEAAGEHTVAIEVWQRDCDHAEGTELWYIKPTLDDYDRLDEYFSDNAELAYSLSIIDFADTADWRPMFHDVAAELAGY